MNSARSTRIYDLTSSIAVGSVPRRLVWRPIVPTTTCAGIYLPPAKFHWSLRRLPEQLEFADEERDEVYWELGKSLRLALKANPSVLETLWTPMVLLADETAKNFGRFDGCSSRSTFIRLIPAMS